MVQEYERAVIFRLGRLLAGGSRGPGNFIDLFRNYFLQLDFKFFYKSFHKTFFNTSVLNGMK